MLLRKTSTLLVFLLVSILGSLGIFAPKASAATQVQLGGMNLSGYCGSTSQGDSTLNGNTWACTNGLAINMTSACQWQYPGRNATALQTSLGNPYSWSCYREVPDTTPTPSTGSSPTATPTPSTGSGPTPTRTPIPTAAATPTPTTSTTRLGGMNLYAYCQSLGQGGSNFNGQQWTCSSGTVINMNTACQWQYNPTAVARQEAMNNPYTWACYSGSLSVTPTPTLSPTPSPSVTPTPASGSATYLALGDSFAFGFHLAQYQQEIANHTYNPASFNDGYDAVLLKDLQGVNANMQEVNYACPGETSGSFVNGGCAFHSSNQLHNAYPNSQSQLQAAVTYLQAHPGQQTVITLDLGVNDAIALSDICQAQANPIACYNQRTPGVLATVKQNYDIILNALQKVAAQARIILIKAPTPVYYDGTDQLNNGINKIIDDEAFSRGLRNADTASIFTANNICSITNYCANPSDFHPNAQGYSMMANQIWNASGYAKN